MNPNLAAGMNSNTDGFAHDSFGQGSMGMDTGSPSRRPPRFQHIDHTFDEPRQQSPLPIARDLFMDPHSPSTLFPPLSGSFFEPASAAPISQSFNPNIPVPDGPNTTSPYVDFLEQAKRNFFMSNAYLSHEELNRAWFQASRQPSQLSMAHEVPRSMAFNASDADSTAASPDSTTASAGSARRGLRTRKPAQLFEDVEPTNGDAQDMTHLRTGSR
ncbi:unnamed protein product [Alternaria alternata]